ncbi:MAG: retropepsin-like aspartic protease [Candidatus Margulisbacteria bacterium]|nr:retropepsin-like aspartic protease [Candidatus Margulisiibacteriota bacterium]
MIDFSWREDLSESFGKVKRPVAEIFVKDKAGNWRALTMIVDSGADASVINRSFGELFGHDLEKGRPIKIKGFGEQEIAAYVHNMRLKIGEDELDAKVVIADIEKGPNVLGRKDIFNVFEIQFKNIAECTRFIK